MKTSDYQTAEGCIPESRGGREAAYLLIAAKGGDTTPSEPSEPSEPFEPFEPFEPRPQSGRP